jgi:RNA polymerase sigma factor (sigma-70 family)
LTPKLPTREPAVHPRNLQVVLRSLAGEPATGDDELLRQVAAGDGQAFAELVRRHGRLVWAVCRHLTGSDAEADDAFQATFLVLLRHAGKVRDGRRLSAWLHGVAYRVCGRARRSTQRRAKREKAAAMPERNGHAVPDSAWDRALAAVHDEVGRLPETLRVPFVLCCLEGKGVTEAADQLGWKLGTLSGRLTRAKDLLLERLDARGLTAGVAVGLGLAAPPAATVAATAGLIGAGVTIPNSILQLTRGAISMNATRFKLLAATVLLGSGLGLGLGTGGLPTAGAEPPVKSPTAKSDADVKRLQADMEDLITQVLRGQLDTKESPTARTKMWDYDFVQVSDLPQTKFVAFLQDRENRGWEFIGSSPMPVNDKPSHIWIFRRPRTGTTSLQGFVDSGTVPAPKSPSIPNAKKSGFDPRPGLPGYPFPGRSAIYDRAAIEAEIARLQKQLASLPRKKVELTPSDLPLPASEMVPLMSKLAEKKFPTRPMVFMWDQTGLEIEGDTEAVDWAVGLIKKMSEK